MNAALLDRHIDAVRRFNRFYTRQIGVLGASLYGSGFSLTEVRVLYELAHRDNLIATELLRELALDAGYLSRILRGFERRGLIRRRPAPADARRSLLSLTPTGRKTFGPLEQAARSEVRRMLEKRAPAERKRLAEAMDAIEAALGAPPGLKPEPYVLRPPLPGDLGFVVHRHGALYAQEYGYDQTFEALVARIVAEFVERFDAARERCWIAERYGEVVGSVFLVAASKRVAKLRLLYVEPTTRGLGIGARLVDECVRFARLAGYRSITLWTQGELHAARHLYAKAGFRRVGSKKHRSFGKNLVAETWELTLRARVRPANAGESLEELPHALILS